MSICCKDIAAFIRLGRSSGVAIIILIVLFTGTMSYHNSTNDNISVTTSNTSEVYHDFMTDTIAAAMYCGKCKQCSACMVYEDD